MKDKNIGKIETQFKIILNKMLYEENEISLETNQNMKNDLISKLSIFKLIEDVVRQLIPFFITDLLAKCS